MACDKKHFLGRCEECDWKYLSQCTYNEAEDWFRTGVISRLNWERFCMEWRNSAVRYSHLAEQYEENKE